MGFQPVFHLYSDVILVRPNFLSFRGLRLLVLHVLLLNIAVRQLVDLTLPTKARKERARFSTQENRRSFFWGGDGEGRKGVFFVVVQTA